MGKRWRGPNNPTTPARQIYAHLFPRENWPKGWTVKWVGFMRGAAGLTMYDSRMILLSYGDARRNKRAWGVLRTLVHEFVHMRSGHQLRHGREFRALERGLLKRLRL